MRFEFLPAFKGDCFVIHAGTDAQPVLALVDGGPGGTYRKHLRPRLMEIRDERGLAHGSPLVIDLVMVSHVDDDHIQGVIELFREVFDEARARNAPTFEISGLWHNSFDEIIGNDEATTQAAQFGAASFAPFVDQAEDQESADAALILQSVAQGHELRDLAGPDGLDVEMNEGFDDLIRTSTGRLTRQKVGGVTFTIIGPRPAELAELQKAHDKWLKEQKKKGKPITAGGLLQALTDESVANLSSIVVLTQRGRRKALLTGDARSDFILRGLEETGLIRAGGQLKVDLLKMPHHGSDRNVDEEFLRRVTAPKYLFTGNGEHGNPERGTFEMLLRARPGAAMKWYLTYPIAEIDDERKRVHEHERQKEIRKDKPPRAAWSDADHSLAALIAGLPARIEVIEPSGPIVEL